jgi:NIMA (never in mitosis gene a)-related kinase
MQDVKPSKSSTTNDFEFLGKLGKGSFGIVYKVRRKADKALYVLKQINISQMNQKLRSAALNEVKILSSLENPYIVRYFDSFVEKNNLNIVMEFCEGGDLSNYIRNQMGRPLTENKIWKFFIQMLIGFDYIHKKKILHRDIKSMNIFLSKDEEVRIGDLGVAKVLQETTNFAHTMVGTPYYLSPEMCEERPYNEKSDVWALGCVLYEMCTQKHPFEANNQAALILKIIRGKYNPVGNAYSTDLVECVDLCLSKDYKKRPTASILLAKSSIQHKAKSLNLKISNETERGTSKSDKPDKEKENRNKEKEKEKEKEKVEKKPNYEPVDIALKKQPSSVEPEKKPIAKAPEVPVTSHREVKPTPAPTPIVIKKTEAQTPRSENKAQNQQVNPQNNLFNIHYANKPQLPPSNANNVKAAKVLINPLQNNLSPQASAQKLLQNNPLQPKKDNAVVAKVVLKEERNKSPVRRLEALPVSNPPLAAKVDDRNVKRIRKGANQQMARQAVNAAGQQKLVKEFKADSGQAPAPIKISRPVLLGDKEKPPVFEHKILRSERKSDPAIQNMTKEEIDDVKNLPNLSRRKTGSVSSSSNSSRDSKENVQAPKKPQTKAPYIPRPEVSRPSTAKQQEVIDDDFLVAEFDVPKSKAKLQPKIQIPTATPKSDKSTDVTSRSGKSEDHKFVPEMKWKISDSEKNVKIVKMSPDDVRYSRGGENFESVIVTNPTNDSENLEINMVNEDEVTHDDNDDAYNGSQSDDEAYVEEEEQNDDDNYEVEDADSHADTVDYNQSREEEKVERNSDNDSPPKDQNQDSSEDEVEESSDLLTSNFGTKEAFRQAVQKKLDQHQERQGFLEKIIQQRTSECQKQLGTQNVDEIITFFRAKIKADDDLSEKDQNEIDEFITKKMRNNSRTGEVVYNIYKILHLEIELEKCRESIKKCSFELA